MLLASSLFLPAVAGGFVSAYALSKTLGKSIKSGTGDVFKVDTSFNNKNGVDLVARHDPDFVYTSFNNNKNGDDEKKKSLLATPFVAETTKDVLSIAKSYFKIKYLIYVAIGYIVYDLIKE
jgi:hypothetical protein